MTKNYFSVKDFFSLGAAKYLSRLFASFIFILSLMSFSNDSEILTRDLSINNYFLSLELKNTINRSSQNFPINAEVLPFVNDFINEQSVEYSKMKIWGQPYFKLFDKILSANGLPVELKYLSVIESDLQANLVSSADAVGPWQLMPDEAKRFNLKISDGMDERTDFYKSTEVACGLLKDLHNQFGDWLLTIAAYNCGAGRMKQAIAKAGTDDYWKLQYFLPEETRRHVKKYIATDYYFEGAGGFTTMTADETATFLADKWEKKSLTQQPAFKLYALK